MLECKLCDFLGGIEGSKRNNFRKCAFTGHVFIGEAGFDLASYPCENRSYEEFMRRRSGRPEIRNKLENLLSEKEAGGQPTDRVDDKRVLHLTDDLWHLLYLKRRFIETK
jgi:hypothetical protein